MLREWGQTVVCSLHKLNGPNGLPDTPRAKCIWGNLLAQQEMYLLGRRVDFLVGLGQCQLRGVLLVNLEYDVAQANARFIGQATGGHLQAPKDVD